MVTQKENPLFNATEISAIEKQIELIESKTSGEIVLFVSAHSRPDNAVPLLVALFTTFIASTLFTLWDGFGHWGYSLSRLLFLQGIVFFFSFSFAQLPFLQRHFYKKEYLARIVRNEAFALFSSLGIAATKQRTGVLIYLSALEHRVEILADAGIHTHVNQAFWEEASNTIAKGFKEKTPLQPTLEVLTKIGNELSKHFPPEPNNPNELSNKVLS